jgi:hypothetical protein
LALFGRRPHERVDRFDIPASENLHKSGRPRADGLDRRGARGEGQRHRVVAGQKVMIWRRVAVIVDGGGTSGGISAPFHVEGNKRLAGLLGHPRIHIALNEHTDDDSALVIQYACWVGSSAVSPRKDVGRRRVVQVPRSV